MKAKSCELAMLREKCMVMRNLLRDISENENHLDAIPYDATHADTDWMIDERADRRRALVDEIDYMLLAEEYTAELKV